MNYFNQLSASSSFTRSYNLLPHYTPGGQDYASLMLLIRQAVADGRTHAFFLADRTKQPQGFSSLDLARDILAAGTEPVVSLSLAYYDRSAAASRLQEYLRTGVRNFLLVSGDFPAKATGGKPVFDLDSVQLLMHLDSQGEKQNMVTGCVVSPFKTFESEQVWQYEKLRRKVEVGADFIVSQPGYDIRKLDELLRFCRLHAGSTPLIASVLITDTETAKLVQARTLPGVTIPGPLLQILYGNGAGRRAIIERTAMTLAVMEGLGYHGALIGGHTADFAEVRRILDRAEALLPEWQNLPGRLDFSDRKPPFYYFEKDEQTGLNTDIPTPVALKHFPTPAYTFSYFVDWLVYVPGGPLFSLAGRFCLFCSTRKPWYRFLWLLEYISKRPLYGCTMCGDCTLYSCGFLCYRSGCPKKMLNGPCGGTSAGYCEVFPEKKRCFWVQVYHNMKGVRQHVTFTAPPIRAHDASLERTSSWINFFLGRDHRGMKFMPERSRGPRNE